MLVKNLLFVAWNPSLQWCGGFFCLSVMILQAGFLLNFLENKAKFKKEMKSNVPNREILYTLR